MLLSSLLFSITISSAPMAIPGVLDDINIGDVPKIWVDTGNDNLNLSRSQPDDNRTFAFSGGCKIDDHLVFLGDYSALTEKNTTHTRIDELTFALGYVIQKNGFIICPTIGTRLKNNYYGGNLQNEFHSAIEPKSQPIDASNYQKAPTVLLGGLSIEYDKELYRGLYDDAAFSYGYSIRGVGLMTTSGEVQSAIQAVLYGEQISWYSYYLGIRQEFRCGSTGSSTAQQVAGIERGTYFIMGTCIDDVIYLMWGTGITTSFAYGSIGIMERF